MTTRKKSFITATIALVAASLLFAQAKPTGLTSLLITAKSILDIPLDIKLASGATALAVKVRTSTGTTVYSVDPAGIVTTAGGIVQTSATASVRHYSGAGAPATTTTGTDTAGINGTVFVSELFMPANATLTGISFLIGSVGGTDKAIVSLYDSAGAVLATSALAGVTVGTTATMQRIPFTATYAAKGPALYFVGVQYNGTTAKLRTGTFGDKATSSVSQTFGTPVAITPPTTFTASVGPIAMTY